MFSQIFGNARFSNAQMFGKLGFDSRRTAASRCPPQQIRNRDAQRLTIFRVIMSGEIRIAEQKHSRPGWRAIRFIELQRRGNKEAPKMHFPTRKPGTKARSAKTRTR